jgi:hypothetical protein
MALAAPAAVSAQAPVLEIDWSSTQPTSGHVVDGSVSVTADAAGGTFPLVSVATPDLGRAGYEIAGQVRYANVEGRAYLEMWSIFPDGGRYFSRTLGESGPVAALAGTSDWRSFELPFSLDGSPPPVRLEVSVVLPAAGSVTVGTLRLLRLDAARGESPDRLLGVLGGVAGTLIGVVGAILGWLVARRRARTAVLAIMTGLSALGILAIAAGVAAAIAGQPTSVVFVLLLFGVITASVFWVARRGARRAYADAELRRMRAMDQG